MSKRALYNLSYYTGPLRRFSVLPVASYVVVAIGLVTMMAFTVPELREAQGFWLSVCLWCCLAYFLFESVMRFRAARRTGTAADRLFTPARCVDLLMVLPFRYAWRREIALRFRTGNKRDSTISRR
jgi:hypothetical protein